MPTWATTPSPWGARRCSPTGTSSSRPGSRVSSAIFGQSIEVLPDGTKTYVQQMTGLEYRSYFMSTLYGTPANLLDPGFEYSDPGDGPVGLPVSIPRARRGASAARPAWRATAATSPPATPTHPQGSQVAFLQKTGSISQAVDFAAAGSYVISFSAAQRGNFGTSNEEVQVLVDGTVVGTFTPAGTSYATYTTASFNVTAGSHTITFAGVDPSGADYTAFLDQVTIEQRFADGVHRPRVFESPSVGTGPLAYQYRPTGSAWSFSGSAGLAGNGSNFTAGNPNAPAGQPGRLPPEDRLDQPGGESRGGRLLPDQFQRRPARATSAPATRRSRCWWTARWWAPSPPPAPATPPTRPPRST